MDEFNKISWTIDLLAQNYVVAGSITIVTDDHTASTTEDVILCNGELTVTLFTASGVADGTGKPRNSGRRITVKNIGTSTVTIATVNSQTIDGEPDAQIPAQYTALELYSNGSDWYII